MNSLTWVVLAIIVLIAIGGNRLPDSVEQEECQVLYDYFGVAKEYLCNDGVKYIR